MWKLGYLAKPRRVRDKFDQNSWENIQKRQNDQKIFIALETISQTLSKNEKIFNIATLRESEIIKPSNFVQLEQFGATHPYINIL